VNYLAIGNRQNGQTRKEFSIRSKRTVWQMLPAFSACLSPRFRIRSGVCQPEIVSSLRTVVMAVLVARLGSRGRPPTSRLVSGGCLRARSGTEDTRSHRLHLASSRSNPPLPAGHEKHPEAFTAAIPRQPQRPKRIFPEQNQESTVALIELRGLIGRFHPRSLLCQYVSR
jgi:hypothetical protein